MNNNKVLTISIAAYNVEEYLAEALESLITNRDVMSKMEILIVNDGSQDGTKALAEKYAARYPQSIFVISKENGGWGSTVNYGIKYAHGKYFKLLDGDDWFNKAALPGYLSFLEQTDADLVVTPFVKYYANRKREVMIDKHQLENGRLYSAESLKPGMLQRIAVHELTVKTEVLRKNNIRISEHCFFTDQEFDYYTRLYVNTICKYIDKIYYYRIGREGQSISTSSILKHFDNIEHVTKRLVQEYKHLPKGCLDTTKYNLLETVAFHVKLHYRALVLFPETGEAKQKILELDTWIRDEVPDLYNLLGRSYKIIKLLRWSRFHFYSILHFYLICKCH